MLIIGSYAMHDAGYRTGRPVLDRDAIATSKELKELIEHFRSVGQLISAMPISGKNWVLRTKEEPHIWEIEVAYPGTAAEDLLKRHNPDLDCGPPAYVATPAEMLALKLSHRYLKDSPHFLKTMRDIQMLRKAGVTLDAELQTWLKKREAETYVYKHPSLKQSKQDFFQDDGIRYVYDHDSIHEAITALPRPAYTYFKADQAEVWCDKSKFFACPRIVQLIAVMEEAMVLALERSQIPHRGEVTPRRSFELALMKVCTSITSGWFREFAWENYDTVMGMYDDGYADRFWKAVDEGRVRLGVPKVA